MTNTPQDLKPVAGVETGRRESPVDGSLILAEAQVTERAKALGNLLALLVSKAHLSKAFWICRAARDAKGLLEHVELREWTTTVGDAAVAAVVSKCSQLSSLNRWGCSNITNAAVVEVVAVASGWKHLKMLDLRDCQTASTQVGRDIKPQSYWDWLPLEVQAKIVAINRRAAFCAGVARNLLRHYRMLRGVFAPVEIPGREAPQRTTHPYLSASTNDAECYLRLATPEGAEVERGTRRYWDCGSNDRGGVWYLQRRELACANQADYADFVCTECDEEWFCFVDDESEDGGIMQFEFHEEKMLAEMQEEERLLEWEDWREDRRTAERAEAWEAEQQPLKRAWVYTC